MKDNVRVILASASPRRRELLEQIGMEFEILVSDVDEGIDGLREGGPQECVKELSRRKAQKVYEQVQEEADGKEAVLVIGADTLVAKEDLILGKPSDRENALHMLKLLEGDAHQVHTAVTCIYKTPGGDTRIRTFSETARVWFYPMSQEEMEAYADSGEPMDKAGAYGIQGLCARYIKGIEGDYNTVVGLPVGRLYQELKSLQERSPAEEAL